MGPRSGVPAASKLRAGREWLRSRGPVTLAAALLLEVSSATTPSGSGVLGLLRAALLVVLLLGVLIAAAVDSLLSSAARGLVRGWVGAALWTRVSIFGLPAPLDLSGAALLDRAGRPLRGGARNARIALLQRDLAQRTYARSLRGRLDVALAALRRVARPYSRRVAHAGLAVESRVLSARAVFIARSISAAAWVSPRAGRGLVAVRSRAMLLWRGVHARVAPLAVRAIAAVRPLAARLLQRGRLLGPALKQTTTRGLTRSRAGLAAIPVPAIPLPSMSLRTIRVVSGGVLLSFVFATVIGTTGLVANRGSVALGASTTLAIISGDVSVMDPGASEFRPGFDGDILGAGSTIKTGPETYAVLTYFEGSTVSIDPNTILVIEALQANPDGSTVIGMRQDIGQTWHAVTKLLTAGSKYEVRTPTATATVRGTLFLVGVQLSGDLGLPETLIETTEGAVAAEREPTPEEPEGEEIVVPAGFQVKATEAAPIPPANPAPEPERKITVTVGTVNSVVVDPQGRSNGEVNGRIVVQTPGATVERVDGKIVVTLPNTTDGKISTIIQPAAPPDDDDGEEAAPPAPVQVTTVVQERGKSESRSEETVQQTTQPTVTGVEVKRSTDQAAPPELRKLDETEKKDAPKVKVAEAPAEEVRALVARRADEKPASVERSAPGQEGGASGQAADPAQAEPSPKGIVNAIVTLTLPPLSADEVARREQQKRESEEREKRENEQRAARQREEDQKKIAELRRKEEEARTAVERISGERQQEEGRRDVRRESEDRRGEESRREEARQGNEPAAPVALLQQVIRAIAPADSSTRRDEDTRVDELKKQEQEANKAAEKAAEERRRAEQRLREDSIKAEEEKRKEAEKRGEELRKAEEKAQEQAARQAEELRKIEEKAREQAAKLTDDQRREAERRLSEFREAEDRKRAEEAKRLEDQRRAEDRAREDAERRLRELRSEQEQARERERERQRERDREDERRRNRGGFVPNVELRPAPGIGTRSVEDEERSEQLREKQQERQQNAAERVKDDS